MTVDPQTRAIVSEPRVHLKHKGSEHLVTHGGGMDDLLKFAYEIRDIFLKSPAWTILKDQQPDPHFSVDQAGAQHITTPASRRDIFR